jgi:hypothetical protein
MADTKLSALTADATPGLDSLLYTIDDPAGTPLSRKTAISELLITLGILHGASVVSVSGATTATIGKLHVCSGTTYTLTLPAASGNAGKILAAYITATGLVTLDGNASETIDGALTRIMWAGETATLYCDGSNWFKIAGKSRPMACIMRIAANQTGVVTSTLTKVLLDTTDINNTGLVADTTNKRMNILRTSDYLLVGNIVWASFSPASVRVITQVTKNVGLAVLGNAEAYGVAAGSPAVQSVTPGIPLVAGDYIELYAFQIAGSNQAVYGAAAPGASTNLALLEQPSW